MTNRSIITLNQAKDFIGINRGDSAYDDRLGDWIDLASGWIEQRVADKIAPQDSGELILDGSGTGTLTLPFSVIGLYGDSLSNLQYRESVDDEWSDLVDTLDNLAFNGKSIEIIESYTFPLGRRNIRVRVQAGWDPKPADLVQVCMEKTYDLYNKSVRDRLGKSSASFNNAGGNVTENYSDLSKEWEKVFALYAPPKTTVSAINC